MFEHGERFYNFRGLRAFKSKFHPQWQPRYLAVAGGTGVVLALMDVTLLSYYFFWRAWRVARVRARDVCPQ